VRSAGGHIWLYTEPGQGTTFKVYLPQLGAEAAAAQTSPTGAPPLGSADRVILVAEDDPVVRLLTVRIIERAGYTVVTSHEAEAALAILADPGRRVDALVTDVSMPGISGPELARVARRARPGIGILLVSGFLPESEPIDDLLAAGAEFVSKPVSAPDLLELLHRVVSR
jgi:two-component system cell cycle sensor histidine kinase/response regulator CckA